MTDPDASCDPDDLAATLGAADRPVALRAEFEAELLERLHAHIDRDERSADLPTELVVVGTQSAQTSVPGPARSRRIQRAGMLVANVAAVAAIALVLVFASRSGDQAEPAVRPASPAEAVVTTPDLACQRFTDAVGDLVLLGNPTESQLAELQTGLDQLVSELEASPAIEADELRQLRIVQGSYRQSYLSLRSGSSHLDLLAIAQADWNELVRAVPALEACLG